MFGGPPSSAHTRIDYVDGLRAIAVLGVVTLHSQTNGTAFVHGTLLQRLVEAGTHGVDLFFVISGFCLSYPTLRKLYATGAARFDVGEFFTRRIVRIFPPFWFAIFVCLAFIAWYQHQGEPLTYGLNAQGSWKYVVEQFFLIRHRTWLLAVFWTLQIEFLWYIAFPICLALWVKARPWFFAVALLPQPIGFLLLHYAPQAAPYLPFWLMLLPFMLGIAAADTFLRKPAWTKWALPAAVACAIFGLAFEWQPKVYEGDRGIWSHVAIGWQLASFFFVVAAGSIPALTRALALRPIAVIGVASYSIYLVHALIAYLGIFHRHGMLIGLVAGAGGVAFGFLFWFLFERPVTETPLRDRLWGVVGKVARPALSWWRLPEFTVPVAAEAGSAKT